jgi:hypothetical protein
MLSLCFPTLSSFPVLCIISHATEAYWLVMRLSLPLSSIYISPALSLFSYSFFLPCFVYHIPCNWGLLVSHAALSIPLSSIYISPALSVFSFSFFIPCFVYHIPCNWGLLVSHAALSTFFLYLHITCSPFDFPLLLFPPVSYIPPNWGLLFIYLATLICINLCIVLVSAK